MGTFRLAVVGGRDFNDKDIAYKVLDKMLINKKSTHEIVIVSGGATGADDVAKCYAISRGYKLIEFKADWDNLDMTPCVIKYNKFKKPYNALAGMNRNKDIINGSDAMIAFWDNTSHGTGDDIKLASKADISFRVFDYYGDLMYSINKKEDILDYYSGRCLSCKFCNVTTMWCSKTSKTMHMFSKTCEAWRYAF